MNVSRFSLRYLSHVALVIGLLGLIAYLLWQAWPTIFLSSIKWQRAINSELSDLLYEVRENNLVAALSLAGLSFLYGILHSVGPGHGKVIVTTFLATNPTKVKHGLLLTASSALMQAVVATLLVSALVLVFNHSMRDVSAKADYLISASFIAISVFGVTIIWRTSRALYRYLKHQSSGGDHCNHHHGFCAETLNSASNWKSYAGIIVSIGLRPCTGAIMVLLFSNLVGIYWLGIISAFLMAVGTAVTTSVIALMTLSGKKIIQRYLQADKHQHASLFNLSLQLIGGILLTLLGLLLFSSQTYSVAPMLMR